MNTSIQNRIGLAALTRLAYQGADLVPIANELKAATSHLSKAAGAFMDLSVIEQLKGNLALGLDYQLKALSYSRYYKTSGQSERKLRVLVFAAPIHMGGNTPIEFLLDTSEFEIITYYVIPGMPAEESIPDHDIAFVAAPGDSGVTRQFIDEVEAKLENWSTTVLNAPSAIKMLERDTLEALTKDITGIRCPSIKRCDRKEIERTLDRGITIEQLTGSLGYTFIIRPVGSHAGRGLEKIRNPGELIRYLQFVSDAEFFISEYVDYSCASDGAFRKYRIVFVDGKPYPCHMAIADQWKVWYMNAGMAEDAGKRAEEATFMDQFDQKFAVKHRDTLNALTEIIGLDYFGIDCAEDRFGNLVLFEADNALIVHDMDCKDMFPYKQKHMSRLFGAFEAMLKSHCAASLGVAPISQKAPAVFKRESGLPARNSPKQSLN